MDFGNFPRINYTRFFANFADFDLQIEELELSKAKATELLKAHDGDAVKAMRAYVTTSV